MHTGNNILKPDVTLNEKKTSSGLINFHSTLSHSSHQDSDDFVIKNEANACNLGNFRKFHTKEQSNKITVNRFKNELGIDVIKDEQRFNRKNFLDSNDLNSPEPSPESAKKSHLNNANPEQNSNPKIINNQQSNNEEQQFS